MTNLLKTTKNTSVPVVADVHFAHALFTRVCRVLSRPLLLSVSSLAFLSVSAVTTHASNVYRDNLYLENVLAEGMIFQERQAKKVAANHTASQQKTQKKPTPQQIQNTQKTMQAAVSSTAVPSQQPSAKRVLVTSNTTTPPQSSVPHKKVPIPHSINKKTVDKRTLNTTGHSHTQAEIASKGAVKEEYKLPNYYELQLKKELETQLKNPAKQKVLQVIGNTSATSNTSATKKRTVPPQLKSVQNTHTQPIAKKTQYNTPPVRTKSHNQQPTRVNNSRVNPQTVLKKPSVINTTAAQKNTIKSNAVVKQTQPNSVTAPKMRSAVTNRAPKYNQSDSNLARQQEFNLVTRAYTDPFILKRAMEFFQQDADIIRLQDLEYWVGLIEEYHSKTGKYPLQYSASDTTRIVKLRSSQHQINHQFSLHHHTSRYEAVSTATFIRVLEQGLKRKIAPSFDPQMSSASKPNFYTYRVKGDTYSFSVATHNPFSFSQRVAQNYHSVVVSNKPNSVDYVLRPDVLFSLKDYQRQVVKQLLKPDFFSKRRIQMSHSY